MRSSRRSVLNTLSSAAACRHCSSCTSEPTYAFVSSGLMSGSLARLHAERPHEAEPCRPLSGGGSCDPAPGPVGYLLNDGLVSGPLDVAPAGEHRRRMGQALIRANVLSR
ncbi:unnamed protein product [Gadus morhua 'NCC']